MLRSREELSCNNIAHNMSVNILQVYLLILSRKYRKGTQFKGDEVNQWIKRQIVETLPLYSLKKIYNISGIVLFFWVLVTKQWLENDFGFSLWSEMFTFYASLKF